MNTMGIVADENEMRVLGEAELDAVAGGDTVQDFFNQMLSAVINLQNSQYRDLINGTSGSGGNPAQKT